VENCELKSYEVLERPEKYDFSKIDNDEELKIATLKHYWTEEEVRIDI
jgi:hypothetical protein